jgi:transposase InsO family protein
METMSNQHSISEMADALEVSASGYADHLKKGERPRRRQDRELGGKLQAIFQESRKTYGLPRLQASLRQQGIRCGKKRIARLQDRHGLHPVQKRRFRPQTTQSDPSRPAAPNWLQKMPAPERSNQVWVSDITYIETREGWLYLAGILDLFSRKVVGWNVESTLAGELVVKAWKKAWQKRQPAPGLLHHSDRGCQYASAEFRDLLTRHRTAASMSRKGNCYDNAAMESFWATLKTECFGRSIPETKEQARLMIFDYIEAFYNRTRLHSALGYKSPLDFESPQSHKPEKP